MMNIPAIWVLDSANKTSSNAMLSPADLVRYLTYQALQIEGTVTTEKQMSLRHSQLEEAKTSQDWLGLFKLIVQDLGGQIYIIIDLATVSSGLKGSGQANLIYQLNEMLGDLDNKKPHKGSGTKVKIILLVYDDKQSLWLFSENHIEYVVAGTIVRILLADPSEQRVPDAESMRVQTRLKWSLGTGDRIKNSPCPLCRLVLSSLKPSFFTDSSTYEIHLAWTLGPSGRYAFLCSRSRQDTWIGFSSRMEAPDRPYAIWKFFVEPWTGPVVDASRILRWISSCEQLYGSRCVMPMDLPFAEAFPGLRTLRLIDIEDDCIVEMTGLEKYIALSYVWGAVTNFRLTKANRTALLMPGSLKRVF
ncbi:hypothetical protein J7337_002181 [Fusarium musae]|uniref:Heterokaryon incompatibility domain-containing protein n=1 Tax=Fusarium musae TaxID=1042133 RepID=A0A9P8DNN5_9HYPO|nr:hypothetical protein J7337_002181 [Fusarium musae]KAG9505215.1 hypothetical protein J7337_002181 [Fusarium musae]